MITETETLATAKRKRGRPRLKKDGGVEHAELQPATVRPYVEAERLVQDAIERLYQLRPIPMYLCEKLVPVAAELRQIAGLSPRRPVRRGKRGRLLA